MSSSSTAVSPSNAARLVTEERAAKRTKLSDIAPDAVDELTFKKRVDALAEAAPQFPVKTTQSIVGMASMRRGTLITPRTIAHKMYEKKWNTDEQLQDNVTKINKRIDENFEKGLLFVEKENLLMRAPECVPVVRYYIDASYRKQDGDFTAGNYNDIVRPYLLKHL